MDIVIPKLNDNDLEVKIVGFLAQSGQTVEKGEPILEVETSKSAVELEAEDEGVLSWYAAEGDIVAILETIGRIDDPAAPPPPAPKGKGGKAKGSAPNATVKARRLAEQLGIDLGEHDGVRILREADVQAMAEPMDEQATTPPPVAETMDDTGRLDDGFVSELQADPDDFSRKPSGEKIAAYRAAGAKIGGDVSFGEGSVLVGDFLVLGEGTRIGARTRATVRAFRTGKMVEIGENCKFFCRDLRLGDGTTLRWNVVVVDGQGGIFDCTMGAECLVSYDCYVNTDRDVTLGNRVCLSPGVKVYTHSKWLPALDGNPFAYNPVSIGDRCWIGPQAQVLPGVDLPANVTVMGNSVVANTLPENALAGGVPAKVLKQDQRQDLTRDQRCTLLARILDESRRFFERSGWEVEAELIGEAIWSYLLRNDAIQGRILATDVLPDSWTGEEGRLVVLLDGPEGGDGKDPTSRTVFDLRRGVVRGHRDALSETLRQALHKYGHDFQPLPWRFGRMPTKERYEDD